MPGPLLERITSVNRCLAPLLQETERALRGESSFGVEQVLALSQTISGMAPIMANAKQLRLAGPEISSELDLYQRQIGELQFALEKVRMMLLARRAGIDSARSQLQAAARWADAAELTR